MVLDPLEWGYLDDGEIAEYKTQMVRERSDDPFNHCMQYTVARWIVDERG